MIFAAESCLIISMARLIKVSVFLMMKLSYSGSRYTLRMSNDSLLKMIMVADGD